MKIEITVLISTVTALAGMLIGIAGAGRTHRLDIEKRSRETATIISEIGYVKSGIDDIKHRQEKLDERHYALAAQVSRIEATIPPHVM
ncbi:MAG: hypothetical protein II977_07050 [Oscillospiraceae bacterium]|nr:hypothetical protein [Oscillospiraceae bacterium]